MNRRDFLATASAAGLTAALGVPALAADEPIKIALPYDVRTESAIAILTSYEFSVTEMADALGVTNGGLRTNGEVREVALMLVMCSRDVRARVDGIQAIYQSLVDKFGNDIRRHIEWLTVARARWNDESGKQVLLNYPVGHDRVAAYARNTWS